MCGSLVASQIKVLIGQLSIVLCKLVQHLYLKWDYAYPECSSNFLKQTFKLNRTLCCELESIRQNDHMYCRQLEPQSRIDTLFTLYIYKLFHVIQYSTSHLYLYSVPDLLPLLLFQKTSKDSLPLLSLYSYYEHSL